MRITARIQFVGMLNRCEASATKTVKGRAERWLAVRAIEDGSARADPSNSGPENKKTHAAHTAKWTDGKPAGALVMSRADNGSGRICW